MIEVKQTESGRWGLYVNDVLIGDAKSRFDADHAKVMLEKALRHPAYVKEDKDYQDIYGYTE